MEAAAQRIKLLSQRLLPEDPHYLSLSIDQRYRVRPDGDRYFEECHNTRLQWFTLISEGDRGVAFTRPYYDMREDPPGAAAAGANATAPTAAAEKKNVTKLSLSDYKNKLKKSSSHSPDEASPALPPPRRADDAARLEDTRPRDALGITVDKPRSRDPSADER